MIFLTAVAAILFLPSAKSASAERISLRGKEPPENRGREARVPDTPGRPERVFVPKPKTPPICDSNGSPGRPPVAVKAGAVPTTCSVANPSWVGDGFCDKSDGYNTKDCNYDGGDCCPGTCTDNDYTCGHNGYDCTTGCSNENKLVRIYKFWINGDCDSGSHGEHQLRLDGHTHFPKNSNDCSTASSGYCEFREGQVHNINSVPQVMPAWQSISVGTEEHDTWSANDSYSATMSGSQWYIDTCETYEVVLSRDFYQETGKSVCWELSAELSAEYKGANGGLASGVTSCSEWTEPAQSFVWYLKVESAATEEVKAVKEVKN